ncbi:hypothetical protein GCM10009738_05940 [Kitasatospora viridis]
MAENFFPVRCDTSAAAGAEGSEWSTQGSGRQAASPGAPADRNAGGMTVQSTAAGSTGKRVSLARLTRHAPWVRSGWGRPDRTQAGPSPRSRAVPGHPDCAIAPRAS